MSGTVVFVGSFLVSAVLLSLMFVSSAEVQHLRQFLLAPDPAEAAPTPKPAKAPKAKRPKAEDLIALEIQAAAEAAEAAPAEEEAEEEAGEVAPVDESAEGFRQSKVAIMKFLEQALAGMMKEGFRLDAISKFGCQLFLAGAAETLGRRNIAVMPGAQGVHRWPRREDERNRTLLAQETTLPVPDQSMDRVLLVHALENSEVVRPMLREVWQILSPEGRVILVVPNRRGLLARFKRTPFGHGHPFTPPQIVVLLSENLFSPISVAGCLYVPPLRSAFMLRGAAAFEKLGARGIGFGSVLVAEASKQMYAMVRPSLAVQRAVVAAPSVDGT